MLSATLCMPRGRLTFRAMGSLVLWDLVGLVNGSTSGTPKEGRSEFTLLFSFLPCRLSWAGRGIDAPSLLHPVRLFPPPIAVSSPWFLGPGAEVVFFYSYLPSVLHHPLGFLHALLIPLQRSLLKQSSHYPIWTCQAAFCKDPDW